MRIAPLVLSIIAVTFSVCAFALGVVNWNTLHNLRVNSNALVNGTQLTNANAPTNTTRQPALQVGQDITKHSVYVTSSMNPKTFADVTTPTFEKASVPDAVLLTQDSGAGDAGDLLMYFPSFENFTGNGSEQIAYARSTDNGETWSERQMITLSGKQNDGAAVDPSLVQLSDGRLRMYFYGADSTFGDPAATTGNHNIYSAVSSDGEHFTVEDGIRVGLPQITDPEVVYLNDHWVMYISKGTESLIATSKDGLAFTVSDQTWNGGGVPGAYVDDSDIVHVYGCGTNGIMTQISTDGITFTGSATSALRATGTEPKAICDPSPVQLFDGTVLMVYKKV
jgi:hypothetical protein